MKALFFPFIFLFVTPWIQRLAYENMRVAAPYVSHPEDWALGLGLIGAIIGIILWAVRS